jgi:hypothetical protein
MKRLLDNIFRRPQCSGFEASAPDTNSYRQDKAGAVPPAPTFSIDRKTTDAVIDGKVSYLSSRPFAANHFNQVRTFNGPLHSETCLMTY